MPRRYVDYLDAFGLWNAVSTWGAYITLASTVFFVICAIYTVIAGRRVGANYWDIEEDAQTLEWTVSSPPPFHTFDDLPVIKPQAGH